jgi:hypothetical protein
MYVSVYQCNAVFTWVFVNGIVAPCTLNLQNPVVALCTAMFNIEEFYVPPTECICVFCVSEQTTIIPFYNIRWPIPVAARSKA